MDDVDLIKAFVECFPRLDLRMVLSSEDPFPPQLVNGGIDPQDWSLVRWRPGAVATDPSHLKVLRNRLQRRLPRLYEQLILSYRWLEVDLHKFVLMANPLGDSLDGLWRNMTAVPGHAELLAEGLVPLGAGSLANERVCFDLRAMDEGGDCPVVQVKVASHVDPMTRETPARITRIAVLWPSVEAMMLETIEAGTHK